MSGIRSWVAALFLVCSCISISGFRTWLLWKAVLEPQDVAGGLALVGARIMTAHPVDQAQFFELCQMLIQRRDRHFRIIRQPRLCRETAKIRVVTIAEKPQHDLGGRFQPALLNGPYSCLVAHGAALRAGWAARWAASGCTTRVVKP